MTNSLHLDQKLCFYSSRSFVLIVRTTSAHRVDFINENYWRLFGSGNSKKLFDKFLAFSNILAHNVRWWDEKECALSLCSACFCEIGLPCSWWSIKQDSSPRFSSTFEDLRESKRHNDGLFECIFSILQPGNIIPMDIGLLGNDSLIDLSSKFQFLFAVSTSSASSIFLAIGSLIGVSNV